jgi:C-terminal processing protease CtpA/Prc
MNFYCRKGVAMKNALIFAAIVGLLLTGCSKHVQRVQKAPGSIVGIGVMLRQSQGRPLSIMDVVSNTPAFQAGLTPGLVIEKIDGTPTESMTLMQSVNMMRGPEGSTLTLEIIDPKNDTTNSVTLTREKIALPHPGNAPRSVPVSPAPGP